MTKQDLERVFKRSKEEHKNTERIFLEEGLITPFEYLLCSLIKDIKFVLEKRL